TADLPGVPAELAKLLPGLCVPQLDREVRPAHPTPVFLVHPGTGKGTFAVGREGHSPDPARLILETGDLFPRPHVPQANRPVLAAGEQSPAIRGQNGAVDLARVPLEAAHLPEIPLLDQPHKVPSAATDFQVLAGG